MKQIKKIAVLTSGGDSPGMNAAIRAVVRTGINEGFEMVGSLRGYHGLISGDIVPLHSRSVSNIIQRGGTILKSARCKAFYEKEGREKAHYKMQAMGIDALVVIGGDGTFTGARLFGKEYGVPIVGLPGTIDNDLYGTDYTIGYDTAINTVVEAVDKLRDTASSHDRLFIIEVMGRDAGYIALTSGIATGAEMILVPESPTYIDEMVYVLEKDWKKNKTSGIIIVSEGDDSGGALEVEKEINNRFPEFETRVSILGHIQRGGSPTAMDRVLASRLGNAAIMTLKDGVSGVMVGMVDNEIDLTSFEKSIKHHQQINLDLLDIARVLAI
ncbi:MAG: 6-phosphofructokinase [Bacteroidetes bacterium]|nr:MAG: 6-phosphofructokinase [Bacteroidota bacterium]